MSRGVRTPLTTSSPWALGRKSPDGSGAPVTSSREKAIKALKDDRGVKDDTELDPDALRELVDTFKGLYKDETGDIFHTYSSYARGNDMLIGAYNYLDLVPKGRDEDALAFTMAWVRHHDRYGDDYHVDPLQPYVAPRGSDCSCGAGEDHS